MIRSFVDSGVLIDAARGVPPFDTCAFEFLDDANRIYLTSPLVRLEVVPKAAYLRRSEEIAIYNAFFDNPSVLYCHDWASMAKLADDAARRHGLAAMDALHLAAAYLLGADEFVTVERPTKPLYRSELVRVVYLYSALP